MWITFVQHPRSGYQSQKHSSRALKDSCPCWPTFHIPTNQVVLDCSPKRALEGGFLLEAPPDQLQLSQSHRLLYYPVGWVTPFPKTPECPPSLPVGAQPKPQGALYSHSLSQLMVLCVTLPLSHCVFCLLIGPRLSQQVIAGRRWKNREGKKANKESINEWITIIGTWDTITLVCFETLNNPARGKRTGYLSTNSCPSLIEGCFWEL